MTRITIAAASPVAKLLGELCGILERELEEGGGKEELLGLERRPGEGGRRWDRRDRHNKAKRVRMDGSLACTVRRDLVALRKKLLDGAGRRDLLADVDYTIDQLDNLLAEM
jgi:hypothetical protein